MILKCRVCGKSVREPQPDFVRHECCGDTMGEMVYDDLELQASYDKGVDVGLNGANTINSHFSVFSTEVKLRAWERGKLVGELEKENKDGEEKS